MNKQTNEKSQMPIMDEVKDGPIYSTVQPSISSHVDSSATSSPNLNNGANNSPANVSLVNGAPNVSLVNGAFYSYDPSQQSNGVQGINGANGLIGGHGLDGIHGLNGAHALNRAHGLNLPNGLNDANTLSAANSNRGAVGFNGAYGQNGANGLGGANGANGHNGTNASTSTFSLQDAVAEQIRNAQAQQAIYSQAQNYPNGYIPVTNGNPYVNGGNPYAGGVNPYLSAPSPYGNGVNQYANGFPMTNVVSPMANAVNPYMNVNSPPITLSNAFGPLSVALPSPSVGQSLQSILTAMTPMLANPPNGQALPYRGHQGNPVGVLMPPPPPPTLAGVPLHMNKQQEERCAGKIFVGGLSQVTENEGLSAFFSQFGPVKEAFIKLDSDTLRSRGFGFVTFQNSEDAQKAIDGGPHHLDGKNLDVKHAIPHHLTANPQYTASTKKIYVGGLPRTVDDDVLRAHFQFFGELETAMVMRDREGLSRGFGFVTYKDPNQANFVTQMRFHMIHNHKVECKYSQPKNTLDKEEAAKAAGALGLNAYPRAPAMAANIMTPANGQPGLLGPPPINGGSPLNGVNGGR